MANDNYHTDISTLSSSMLKTILKDPAEFKRQYIDGEKQNFEAGHFIEGTYTHTLLLEPHKVSEDYAFYSGGIKRGFEWQNFWEANQDKTILSAPQKMRGEQYASTIQKRPEALVMLQGGFSEHTLFGNVMGVPVKMRADYINIDQGYIVDVKTTAQPADDGIFALTVKQFGYDLSAALYCDIAHQATGKLYDFYWVVISKQDLICDIYKASSETLSNGAGKVTHALYLYKKCSETGLWVHKQATNFDSKNYEIKEI